MKKTIVKDLFKNIIYSLFLFYCVSKVRQISLGIYQSCSNCLRIQIIPQLYTIKKISEAEQGLWDLAEWLERLTANAVVATVLGSIPESSDTVESVGTQMKQC